MHGSDKRATRSRLVIGIHWYSKLTQILKTYVRHFGENAVRAHAHAPTLTLIQTKSGLKVKGDYRFTK